MPCCFQNFIFSLLRGLRKAILSFGFFSCALPLGASMVFGPAAQAATPAEQFFTSCAYGTIAGAAVGGASLAFVRRPSQNFSRVAVGASVGLYAGILLGIYVLSDSGSDSRRNSSHDLLVYPLISEKGIDGGALNYAFFHF